MGWGGSVGTAAFDCSVAQTPTQQGPVTWQRWSATQLDLDRAAYLMVLQGMPISQMFDHDCWFERGPERVAGPFLFVCGDGQGLWAAQPKLFRVVLGRVIQQPEQLQPAELLGALLSGSR